MGSTCLTMKHYVLLVLLLPLITTPPATQLMSGAGQGGTGDRGRKGKVSKNLGNVAEDVIENGFDVSDVQRDLHQVDIKTLEENEDSIAHPNEKVVGNNLAISANPGVGDLVRVPAYECSSDGTYVAESAYLISPNYPHHYDRLSYYSCDWYLEPLPGKAVHLEWTYFLLYDSTSHYLRITPDGEDGVQYRGGNVPPTRTYGRDQVVKIQFTAYDVDMSGKSDKY